LAYAWGVRAAVQASYILRYWADTDQFRQDTDTFAKRALALNPDESQALLALGILLMDRAAYAQAEVYLRHAYRSAPTDDRIARMLGRVVVYSGRFDEGVAIIASALQRNPGDAMAEYDLAQIYTSAIESFSGPKANAELAAALKHLDASLAIHPTDSALTAKARLVGVGTGDLPTMRSLLDRLSPEGRGEDRPVYTSMLCGLLERKPDRVLEAAALTVNDYFKDGIIAQPTAWSEALAYRIAGKESLARLQWQAAEAVLRREVQDHPNDVFYQIQLATTLAWLDRREEAAREIAPGESAWREQMNPSHAVHLAQYYAALGDTAGAVPLLRLSVDRVPFTSKWMLKLHPWWDKLRGQPEFEALVAKAFSSDANQGSAAASPSTGPSSFHPPAE
jgi:Flp pilus assembly protein TadD